MKQEVTWVEHETIRVAVPHKAGRFVTRTAGRPQAMMASTTDVAIWEWLCERLPERGVGARLDMSELAEVVELHERALRRRVAKFRRAGLIHQVLSTRPADRSEPAMTYRVWDHPLEVGDVFLEVTD